MNYLSARPGLPARILRKLRGLAWKASMIGLPRGPHITRYAMYAHLREIGPTLPVRRGRAPAITHSVNLVDLLGFAATEIVEANYPEHNLLELHPAGPDRAPPRLDLGHRVRWLGQL